MADTSYGGENNVKFTIKIITGHMIPSDGALTIEFPEEYDINLYEPGVTCSFAFSANIPNPTICRIGSRTKIDIYLNGLVIDKVMEYSVLIYQTTTPN